MTNPLHRSEPRWTGPISRRGLLASGAIGLAAIVSACGRAVSRAAPRLTRPTTGPNVGRTTSDDPSAVLSPSTRPSPVGPATQVVHGPRTRHEVALTFHTAGDPAVVDDILHAAGRADTRLTMLVVGTWLSDHPSYARRILAGGHDLGNHTWSHPVLRDDDARQTRAEIVRCRHLLRRLTGDGGRWFRPSGTPRATPLMLREAGAAGYETILAYDVDPLDYTDPGAEEITARVLDAARPGSIISLHTLYEGTALAMPDIIRGLRRNGLEPVAASRLLAGKR